MLTPFTVENVRVGGAEGAGFVARAPLISDHACVRKPIVAYTGAAGVCRVRPSDGGACQQRTARFCQRQRPRTTQWRLGTDGRAQRVTHGTAAALLVRRQHRGTQDVTHVCTLNASAFPRSLVIASDAELTIGP